VGAEIKKEVLLEGKDGRRIIVAQTALIKSNGDLRDSWKHTKHRPEFWVLNRHPISG